MLVHALSLVGAVSLTVICVRLVNYVRLNYLTTCNLRRRYGKAGDWAVVTGASEGIGHAMALDLGRRGFNVCVIARTESKLNDLCRELESMGVEGRAIPFDYANASEEAWKGLFEQLHSMQIAILINNVGVNYAYPHYFDEVDVNEDLRILRVNCEATVRMTKYVLPSMRAKRAGAIVNMSSVSALSPAPFLSVYAGTKAFNSSFSESMAMELREYGIDVLSVTPNVVVSRMTQGTSSRKPRESFYMVNADAMAHQTLDKLGSTLTTSGHRNHSLINGLFGLLPLPIRCSVVLREMKFIKRRAERHVNKQVPQPTQA